MRIHYQRVTRTGTIALLCLAFIACGGGGGDNVFSQDPIPTATPTVAATATATSTPLPTSSVEPSTMVTPTPSVNATATPEPTLTPLVGVTLQRVQTEIFTPNCSGCHVADGIADGTGLFLDSANNSSDLLVNRNSVVLAEETLVIPGDPANSYLIKKLEGAAGIAGERMPRGGPPYLSADQVNVVRSWILEGALGNVAPTVTPTLTPTVTSTSTPTPTLTPTPTVAPAATLAQVQSEIFNQRCAGCHREDGAAAQTGLYLNSESSSGSLLVNQPSWVAVGEILVIPGNATDSYLIKKIENAEGIVGIRMPASGTPWLTTEQVGLISSWINGGALLGEEVPINPKVSRASWSASADSVQITVQLTQKLENESSLLESVLLSEVDKNGEQRLLTADEFDASVNKGKLSIQYERKSDQIESLNVEINNPGVGLVMNAYGMVLDGDNDGEQGGVYILQVPLK